MTEAEREARDAREDKAREKKLREQRYNDKEVIPAPEWLKKNMEEVLKMPPPSLETVEIQMKASKRMRGETATGTEGNMNEKPYTVPLEVVKPD